jgi:AraC family transcriptional regulator of adaptative response/methylated-DNA-[protein]-cysteine methyltransferase
MTGVTKMRRMADRDYIRIERAIQYIAQQAHAQPRLDAVAKQVGLSEFHFQRLFRRWAGISPKRFLQYLTADYARGLLEDSRSVLDATFESGLSSPARLHDLMIAVYGATPGDIRARGADLVIRHGVHSTPFGDCFVAVTERGICALEFLGPVTRAQMLARLKVTWSAATLREDVTATAKVADKLFRAPRRKSAPLHLLIRGTNFQLKVWEALLRIPPGHIASYEDVAHAIGTPSATRAVASAVARNPVGFLIPCHRVIRKTGVCGEYRWGAGRKRVMLAWEAAKFSSVSSSKE